MDHAVTVSVETEPTAISAVRYSQSWVLLLYVYLQLQCCDAALHCSSPSPGGRSLCRWSLSLRFRLSSASPPPLLRCSSHHPSAPTLMHHPLSLPPSFRIPSINPSFPDPLLPSHPRTLTPPAAMAAKVYACHPSLSSPNQSTLPPLSSLACTR